MLFSRGRTLTERTSPRNWMMTLVAVALPEMAVVVTIVRKKDSFAKV